MNPEQKFPKGFWLATPYMFGNGFIIVEDGAFDLPPDQVGKTEWVFCGNRILKSPDWRETARHYFKGLCNGGALVLWLPDIRHHRVPDGYPRITLDDVASVLPASYCYRLAEMDLIDGHAYVVFVKDENLVAPQRTPWRKGKKHLLVQRGGALGDALMASSILPALKAEGWKITLLTRPSGFEALAGDPHIDEIMVVEHPVYDHQRGEFINAFAERFDRIINLDLSVEGELLKISTNADYHWTDEQRRALCGGSYLDRIHKLAGVPGPYRVKFYESHGEAKFAEKSKAQLGPFILWCLKGSAPHKWWPHVPAAVCRLLEKFPHKIVFTGGYDAAPLKEAIEKAVTKSFGDTSRLRFLLPANSPRYPMALAKRAAVVIGPETGIMNAVSMEALPKIVFLSHSAASNLTNDWVNTTALVPTSPCYPCHRLHQDHSYCPKDKETLAAACAASITVPQLITAIEAVLAAHAPEHSHVVGDRG